MALRVGMRVKKVRGLVDIGATGVVVDFNVYPEYAAEGYDVGIKQDGVGHDHKETLFPAGTVYSCKSWQWEPIQPEGHKPVEWSQCLWQPEHIREGVSA